MITILKHTRWSYLWAIAVVLIALLMPSAGPWTIDDAVKRIAAEHAEGSWKSFLADGPVRSALSDSKQFAPLAEPFSERVEGGYELGFSPFTRVLFVVWNSFGDYSLKFFPLLLALIFWWVLRRSGMEAGIVLLPLTFYALVPWEHGLSWLLTWPAIVWIFVRTEVAKIWIAIGGMLLVVAALLRPEALLLLPPLAMFLIIEKRFQDFAAMMSGAAFTAVVYFGLLTLGRGVSAGSQISLNFMPHTEAGLMDWMLDRPKVFYDLVLSLDRNPAISILLLVMLIVGIVLFTKSERHADPAKLNLGIVAFVLFAALFQLRIWTNPLPPLSLLHTGSFAAALPWVALLFVPPIRWNAVLTIAVICIATAILLVPISQGVHFGPRLLLFAVPLLVIALYQSGRMKGALFIALLILTTVQAFGGALLVHARAKEMNQRIRLAESKIGEVVTCATLSQCADLAPLWEGREFFTTSTPRELKQFLIEMRAQKLDTVWLHLGAYDSLYVLAFPEAKPVRPYRMTVIQATGLYTTWWRIYEFLLNRNDVEWGAVLEEEAGYLVGDIRMEDALKLQIEATELQPDSARSHSNLAVLLSHVGRKEEAEREARTAIELNPQLQEPRRLLDELTGSKE